ncbi:MAG: hypothetical protein A2184_02605 [Candidatus Moranbacteria bacterium RIFOXYA1_FULL_44_7]|nr:MAG: hypothetical protein A2184_02605 [Candidatus Moranbacteria bacterium RIFOXYA1_FULL_44_7]
MIQVDPRIIGLSDFWKALLFFPGSTSSNKICWALKDKYRYIEYTIDIKYRLKSKFEVVLPDLL